MASLTPAAASSPAGAPSRSKKRPASPGTGGGPAKKKKAAAPGGSQVMRRGVASAHARPRPSLPLCACSRQAVGACSRAGRGVCYLPPGAVCPAGGDCRVLSVPSAAPRPAAASRLASRRSPGSLLLLASPARRRVGSEGLGWPPGACC